MAESVSLPLPTPPEPSRRGLAALRISSLVVGCLGVGISYVVNAFNVFALALKAHFDLSQTELLLLLAVMFLGLCASLPGGMILDRFGSRWASLLALIISVAGYLMVWSAADDAVYYSDHYYLLVIYFLIAGIGGGLTYMAATASNVRNFSERSRGTIVGVLHASLSAGPAIIMLVYNSFFLNDQIINVGLQDLAGFFLFLTGAFGVINLMGIAVYGHYPPDDPEEEPLVAEKVVDERTRRKSIDLERSRRHAELTGSCHNLSLPAQPPQTQLPQFFTADFQLLFWPFIILTALQMMFVQDITTILVSFGEDQYTIIFPYLTPILGTIAKPLIGMLSDLTVEKVPRMAYVISGGVISAIIWVLSAYLINYISVVLIATTLCDIAAYFVYALGPAIIIERFGLESFARNWGIIMGGFAIVTSCLLFIFGIVYDDHTLDGSTTCYGLSCYFVTFLVSAGISAFALICSVLYLVKAKREQSDSA